MQLLASGGNARERDDGINVRIENENVGFVKKFGAFCVDLLRGTHDC